MTEEPTVKIKLKTVILGLDGKPNKQSSRLRTTEICKKMTDKEFTEFTMHKTIQQLLDLTPTDNLGEGIRHILANCIKTENNAKAAEVYTYIIKVNNCMDKDKAEWTITKDELKKFLELLRSGTENISSIINGQVDTILEEYYAELVQKNKK